MLTLRRIVYLIFRPQAEWALIADEKTSVDELLRRYILPLALLAPIATAIGMGFFDREWDPTHGYQVASSQIFAASATTYFGTIASIFSLAAIFVLVAPMFGSARDFIAALKVATYGSIPVMLAGATLLLPVMAIVALVGTAYTLYLMWLGVHRVLGVPTGSQAEFIGISIVLLALASACAGATASAIGLI